MAKKKAEKLSRTSSRDTMIPDEAIEAPLINYGESLDYGTATVQVQPSPSESTITTPEVKPPLLNRGLIMIYLNYASLTFLEMGYSVLLPLFYSTPIPSGGLGLDPYKIGVALGSYGFVNAVVQAIFLGPLIRKLGARKMYIICFPGLIVCVALYPIMRLLAQHFEGVNNLVIICMVIQLTFQMLTASSYGKLFAFYFGSIY